MNSPKSAHPWALALRILISLAVLGLLVWAILKLRAVLTQFDWVEMWTSVLHTPLWKLGLAMLAAIGSYAAIAGYGAITFRYAGKPLPPARAGIVSFIITTFALNLGLAMLTANLARVRLLSAEGYTPVQMLKSAIAYSVFVLIAPMLLAGIALSWSPIPLPANFPIDRGTTRPLGFIFLAVFLGIVIALSLRSRPISFRGMNLAAPDTGPLMRGLFFSTLEWVFAAMTLAVLLPETGMPLMQLLAVVFIAQFIAVASGVPGGIGVFEVVIVALTPDTVSQSGLLGSILLYRAIYLLGPFLKSLVIFGWLEISRARARVRS
jgi:uncharacterized membrane protein YbhN (UPF0104 family)